MSYVHWRSPSLMTLFLKIMKTFSVLLSTTDLDVSLEPSSASVTIVDNDSEGVFIASSFMCNNATVHFFSDVTVGLQQSSYIVSEDAPSITVCVVLSGEIEREVGCQYWH